MNIAYPLTDHVEINNVEYKIDLSFDNVLRVIDMLNDEDLNDSEQIEVGLRMLFDDNLPITLPEKEEVFYQIFNEVVGLGEDSQNNFDINGDPMPDANGSDEKETYSFEKDSPYIYASFMSDYGIDLFEARGKLHWEKFKALLGGLTEGSKFLRVIEIRTMDLPTGKGNEKQRAHVKKLKEIYKL